jgi:hypothetical protein
MHEVTDIEKKSLEAHVELCAERYNTQLIRLDTLDNKIVGLSKIICEVRDMVQKMGEKRNDQLINWGVGIIGSLVAVVVYLVVNFVFK